MARHVLSTALILVALAPGFAVAGTGQVCPSTKAANDLISCQHCMTLKDLVTAANDGSIQITVSDLTRGVVVQIAGKSHEDIATIHALVDRLWETSTVVAKNADSRFCKGCEKRHQKLAAAIRDRALTDTGAIVVLTADDPGLVDWLRRDAQAQGQLVAAATTD